MTDNPASPALHLVHVTLAVLLAAQLDDERAARRALRGRQGGCWWPG